MIPKPLPKETKKPDKGWGFVRRCEFGRHSIACHYEKGYTYQAFEILMKAAIAPEFHECIQCGCVTRQHVTAYQSKPFGAK